MAHLLFCIPDSAKNPPEAAASGGKGSISQSANQAISLTVMLTSGMASVALLTSISPERICSFRAS